MIACSMPGPSTSRGSSLTQVPVRLLNEDRTWMGTLYRRAYSTQRNCRTFAPDAAISSISSYVIAGIRRAAGTILGSAVKTPSTSV